MPILSDHSFAVGGRLRASVVGVPACTTVRAAETAVAGRFGGSFLTALLRAFAAAFASAFLTVSTGRCSSQ